MNLKKPLLFLIVLCLACSANSQNVPGYLGKKAFLDYNFTSPLFTVLPPSYSNFIHSFNLNYVIRRRTQLGVSYDFFSLKETNDDEYKFDGTLKGNSFGINIDWYNKRSIAPLGRYFRLEGKYLFGDYESVFWNGAQFVKEDKTYAIPVIAMGLGTRRIFFDRIVYNVGGSIGYPFANEEEKKSNALQLLRYTYFWRMHMGIGILLF